VTCDLAFSAFPAGSHRLRCSCALDVPWMHLVPLASMFELWFGSRSSSRRSSASAERVGMSS
jgi:hypothetical protein